MFRLFILMLNNDVKIMVFLGRAEETGPQGQAGPGPAHDRGRRPEPHV